MGSFSNFGAFTVGDGPESSKRKPPINQVAASRCPTCGSTERAGYSGCVEQEIAGSDANGRPYTHIVRKRTKCLKCGQARIDRMYENKRPASEA